MVLVFHKMSDELNSIRGLVTYREVDLLIDDAKSSHQQKQRVAIVVTHELAHQWFGNLVTMKVLNFHAVF